MNHTIGDALSNEQKTKLNAFKKVKPTFTKTNLTNYPDNAFKSVVLLIQNNAEFRRFISLAIKKQLLDAGEITAEDKIYIRYFYKKYSVKINGLCREFFYTTSIFANSYLAAIVAFSTNAQHIILDFLDNECKNVSADVDKANEIADTILKSKQEVVEEEKEGGNNNAQ